MAHLVDRVTRAIIWIAAAFFFGGPAARAATGQGPRDEDHSLIKYMLRGSTIGDPELVTNCFNTYLPMLMDINANYMEAYQKCSAEAAQRVSKLEDAALLNRRKIELAADGICVSLDACGDLDDALNFFGCYSDQSSNATRVIYEVTENSTNFARDLREEYLVSDAEKYKCQNASRRVQVEDTARTYKDLDICLRGGNPSTDAPDTTATTPQTTEPTDTTETSDPTSTTTEAPGTIPPYEPDDPNDPREYKFDRNLKILPHLRQFY